MSESDAQAYADGEQVVRAHEVDDKLVISYHQDIEPHLKYAHAKRAEQTSVDKKGDFRHVMSVPFNVLLDVCTKYGLNFYDPNDSKVIHKILAGPDYKAFRTVPDKKI